MHALVAQHPELECSIREHEPEDGIPLLRSGELDLLVSESYDDVPAAPAGGLEQHVLVSEPLLLALPAPAEETVALAELAGAAWISGVAGTQYVGAVEQACRAAGFAPRVAHRADDATLILGLVAAGLGVGLVPELACTPYAGVRYARADPAPPRRHDQRAPAPRRGAAPALAALLDRAALPRRYRRVAAPGEACPMNKIKLLAFSTAVSASLLLPTLAEARATWT